MPETPLKRAMDRLAVSASEAARATGRSRQSIYLYRSGRKMPAADVAAALCRLLKRHNEQADPSPYLPSDLTVENLFGRAS